MSLLSPLAPYLLWVKLGGAALIASALFIGGCNHGQDRQLAKDTAKLEQMDGWLNAQREQTAILAATVQAIDTETAAAQALAAEQAKQAHAAELRADKAEAQAADAIAAAGKAVEAAKRDPACRKQLEMQTCAALH